MALTSPDPSTARWGVGDDEMVTSEAVAIEIPPASIGLRLASGLIDLLLTFMVLYLVMLTVSVLALSVDAAMAAAIALTAMVLVMVGAPTTIETLTRGRSVGKLACGLRTVRDDGGPITFRHALTRALIAVVEVYLAWGIPAAITCAISGRGKCIGDLAAGTFVIRERVAVTLSPPAPMPAHLQPWAAAADILPLPDDLALALRTFLPAAPSMDPAAREQLGRELLAETMIFVAPPPPPGSHQEYVLSAVVAERRRRDLDRLWREANLRARLLGPAR